MIDEHKLSYLAGIIDGEGSIAIEIQGKNAVRKMNYYSVRLLVVNTSKELMDWLHHNFGGTVGKRKLIKNRRQCYTWNLFSTNSAAILTSCLPYMIVKRRHAEVLIEFMATKPEGIWHVTPEIQESRLFLYNLLKKINNHTL